MASFYYKYGFISPEGIFANVREEFKSYMDTGAIDDLMWPTYVNKCLNRLGKGSYTIQEELLNIEDFEARLPDNFFAVREAWLCTELPLLPYQTANSFYSQAASQSTIQVSPVTSGGRACTNVECTDSNCDGLTCMPVLIQAVYKTNNEITRNVKRNYLLKPGNISAKSHCDLQCANFGSSAPDSFDIRGNKFVTNFRKGIVHLVFYATDYDDNQNQLVPNNYYITEFIEAFLKYKVIETLTNQVNDETFNQLERKLQRYEQKYDETYILAKNEIQKQDAYAKQRRIKQNLNRNQMYELPNSRTRSIWRINR